MQLASKPRGRVESGGDDETITSIGLEMLFMLFGLTSLIAVRGRRAIEARDKAARRRSLLRRGPQCGERLASELNKLSSFSQVRTANLISQIGV